MIRSVLMAAACLLAAAAPTAADEIPLQSHGHALVVRAEINGRFEGRFLLDTGATFCVVSRDVAQAAKIRHRTGGEAIRLHTANGILEATLGEARKVEIGRAAARDVAVAVVEDPPAHGLDGIIGLSFLKNFTYTVDSDNSLLRLER